MSSAARDAAIAAGMEAEYDDGTWVPGDTVPPPAGGTTPPPPGGTTTPPPPSGGTTPPPPGGSTGGTTTPPPPTTITPPPPAVPPASDPVADAINNNAPKFEARVLTDRETVAGQLNGLLSQDSKYMQSARANAMEKANSRGLINSSMAVGAGQKAAIDSAMPIATQDATANFNSANLAQQGNQDVGLTGYKGLIDTAQGEKNFGYRTAENEQAKQSNLDINAAKAQADSALAKQRDDATLAMQTQLKQMDIDLDLTKLDSAEKNRLTESYGNLSQQRLSEIAKVQATPTSQLSNEDKARWIDSINRNYDTSVKTLASISGYTYTTDWMGQSSGGTTTPPTGEPGTIVKTEEQLLEETKAAEIAAGVGWDKVKDPNKLSDAQKLAAAESGKVWAYGAGWIDGNQLTSDMTERDGYYNPKIGWVGPPNNGG